MIDADALMQATCDGGVCSDCEDAYKGQNVQANCSEVRLVFLRIINDAPTIDAVSVVRGEWKPFDLKWGRSIWYCTACEEGVEVPCDIWTHKPIYNYCPNCGARMYGERKESE